MIDGTNPSGRPARLTTYVKASKFAPMSPRVVEKTKRLGFDPL